MCVYLFYEVTRRLKNFVQVQLTWGLYNGFSLIRKGGAGWNFCEEFGNMPKYDCTRTWRLAHGILCICAR